MKERKQKADNNAEKNTSRQKDTAQGSKLSKLVKKHGENFSFFASISTILGLLIAIFTLVVTIRTLNTATSINNTINNTVNNNQIIQNGEVNIFQYNNDSPIMVSIDKAPRYEIAVQSEVAEEKRLLSLAKQYFDNGEYEMAYYIYSSPELRESDYATINRAYCYAHGYGVTRNTEIAMSLYNSVGTVDARRNKLALMIASNYDGVFDSIILDEFDYFISTEDYNVLNYLSLCKYDEAIDTVSESEKSFEVQLSDIYRYELVEERLFTSTQSTYTTPYEKFRLVGTVIGSTVTGNKGIFYRYELYRLRYLAWLERLYE